MKTIISTFLLVCSLFSAVSLELGAIGNDTIEILINTDSAIRGFQFDIHGANLTGGSGGGAQDNGFDVYASDDTALGFSVDGNEIPAGYTGVLTVLTGEITGDVCLPFVQGMGPEEDTPIFADTSGNALENPSITSGQCDTMNTQDDLDVTFNLFETYPNPFNPELNINVSIEKNDHLDILVYNINGQLIHNIYSGLLNANQSYHFTWDASNFSSGIYIIKVDSDNFTQSRIVNLLK